MNQHEQHHNNSKDESIKRLYQACNNCKAFHITTLDVADAQMYVCRCTCHNNNDKKELTVLDWETTHYDIITGINNIK